MASGLSVVPRLQALGAKWSQRGVAAQPDYIREAGRPDTAERYKIKAAAAAGTYNAVMQDIINRNVWGNTMAAIDPRVYTDGIRAKGGRRVEGMQIAAGKWPVKFGPFAEAIDAARAVLPPRGPAMSDVNISRFMSIIRAVHETKTRLQAGVGISPGGYTPASPGYGYTPGGQYYPGAGLPPVAQVAASPPRPQVGSYLGSYGPY